MEEKTNEKLGVKVIASTKLDYVSAKEEFDKIAGLTAGICYLPDTIDTLLKENEEKTFKRAEMIKNSGHHSPFDHAFLTLQLDNIPKILAMYLNNEKFYTTSEKSARYKKMTLPEDEQEYYNKWLEIFNKVIKEEYQEKFPQYFTDFRINKLAQENARYLTSIFTPTSMAYTLTYRQLNILVSLFDKEIEILIKENTSFSLKLAREMNLLNAQLKSLGYTDEMLSKDLKNRNLSLIRRASYPMITQFGDSYTTSYIGSYAQLAQAERHRTIDYSMEPLKEPMPYVPPILQKRHPVLAKEWEMDFYKLADKIPQATLVKINERGTIENFILKAKERQCTMAQLEIDNQTRLTGQRMIEKLIEENHPAADILKPYTKGSRCTFPDFECPTPCGFKDGVKGDRLI